MGRFSPRLCDGYNIPTVYTAASIYGDIIGATASINRNTLYHFSRSPNPDYVASSACALGSGF